MRPMKWTLAELIALDTAFLTPQQVGDVLGTDPHWYRIAARQNPELIPFPFVINGNRTKFPRIPFLRWLGAI